MLAMAEARLVLAHRWVSEADEEEDGDDFLLDTLFKREERFLRGWANRRVKEYGRTGIKLKFRVRVEKPVGNLRREKRREKMGRAK